MCEFTKLRQANSVFFKLIEAIGLYKILKICDDFHHFLILTREKETQDAFDDTLRVNGF